MTTARRILIVDDDEELRESLKDQLVLHDEFEVLTAGTASKGMELAQGRSFRPPRVRRVASRHGRPRGGASCCARAGFKTPIVMLTGNVSDADTILGLDAGANDYVTKPFKFARAARPHPRAAAPARAERGRRLRHRALHVQAGLQAADRRARARKIRLTEKETSILKYLYRAGDKVVSRDVLLHEVWGYNAGVTTHTLETHIYRLRQKIEKDPSQRRAPDHRNRRLQARSLMIRQRNCRDDPHRLTRRPRHWTRLGRIIRPCLA